MLEIVNQFNNKTIFGEGAQVTLEPIAEGGFLIEYPENSEWYKSIRIGWPKYPIIHDDWKETWKDNHEVIYESPQGLAEDWLKSTKEAKAFQTNPTMKQRMRYNKVKNALFSRCEEKKHCTLLKAFHGAPVWTIEEVEGVFKVLADFGWVVQKPKRQQGLLTKWTKLSCTDDIYGLSRKEIQTRMLKMGYY